MSCRVCGKYHHPTDIKSPYDKERREKLKQKISEMIYYAYEGIGRGSRSDNLAERIIKEIEKEE